MTKYKMKVRRLVEAALDVAKFSSECSELEAVLLSSLAGELQEQFGLDDSAAFSAAERLAEVARERLALWRCHGL
ncbi:hypothetical protein [Pyxidicoccus sp. MSG2]|uniref:hypothetical protein n=1 Tax=Pyxidicoccus sp. MSG2 TaxID=2996790 RepID=UPI00226FE0E0|nr:hypothetical protein [Pyxidicoccus sp. MSG2]MCY1023984.1 hypothetical protein [Pyxidicoccus sp. MSG2]